MTFSQARSRRWLCGVHFEVFPKVDARTVDLLPDGRYEVGLPWRKIIINGIEYQAGTTLSVRWEEE